MISGEKPIKRQQGVILLAFFSILFLAAASVLISVLDSNAVEQRRSENTMQALKEAKQSLIAYAALYSDYYNPVNPGPGALPCPDTNGDGDENANCGLLTLGRLPESITLPSGELFPLSNYNTDIDEQFWYSVADNFRRSSLGTINSTTASLMSLDGRNRIAAVLMAPGPANDGQARPSNNSNRYLEDSNTAAPDFVNSTAVNPELFNDRVLAITVDEIMLPITRKVADILRGELDAFHAIAMRYPTDLEFAAWLGALATLPAWFTANGWDVVTNYVQNTDDQATLIFTGCPNISYTVSYNPPSSPDDLIRIGLQC